jgi:hypothetical protein
VGTPPRTTYGCHRRSSQIPGRGWSGDCDGRSTTSSNIRRKRFPRGSSTPPAVTSGTSDSRGAHQPCSQRRRGQGDGWPRGCKHWTGRRRKLVAWGPPPLMLAREMDRIQRGSANDAATGPQATGCGRACRMWSSVYLHKRSLSFQPIRCAALGLSRRGRWYRRP